MKDKITKTLINELKPGPKDQFIWDTELPRFGLKLTPKGRIVYIIQYRSKGRLRRLTIGTHGALTPDQARKQAGIRLGVVAEGEDPAEGLAEEKRGVTVKELSTRYLQEHATKKKPRSAVEDKRLLEKIIQPALGTRTAYSITRVDVGKLHHQYRKTPYQANRVLALMRKMMNLAESWGLRPINSNPCTHIEKFKEKKRRRFLALEELARLGGALKAIEKEGIEPPQALAAIRLLLFTGARVSEILTAKWEYVNHKLHVLELPDSKTGFKTIPLPAPALEVIDSLPAIEGNPYLIAGRRRGAHFVGLEHIWYRVREKAELPDVRLHDLRHSYASMAAASGLGLPMIGALLGHTDQATTQRYAHLQQDPVKAAAELIGTKIDKALKTKPKKLHAVK